MNRCNTEPRIVVVFRNDDLSGLSDLEHERRIFALFERRGIPQTLGVIPYVSVSDVHIQNGDQVAPLVANEAVCDFLRQYAARSGSEIALHGYTHRTNRYSMPKRREYYEFKKLPLAEQERMLRQGMEALEQALGVRPVTFIAPWNRLDGATVAACVRVGLRIVSAGPFVPCPDGIAAFGTNSSLNTFAQDWAAAKASNRRAFLHVLFHSRTLRIPEELGLLANVLETVSSDPECLVMTVKEAVARFPTELSQLNEAGRNVVTFSEVAGSNRAKLWFYLKLACPYADKTPPVKSARAVERLYRQADYTGCARLTRVIESQARRMLWTCRGVMLLAGSMLACAAWAILSGVLTSPSPRWLWAATAVPALAGAVLARVATADETRREARRAGLLMAAGFLATIAAIRACSPGP